MRTVYVNLSGNALPHGCFSRDALIRLSRTSPRTGRHASVSDGLTLSGASVIVSFMLAAISLWTAGAWKAFCFQADQNPKTN